MEGASYLPCVSPFTVLITLIALQSYNLSYLHHACPKESAGRTKAPAIQSAFVSSEKPSRATKRLFYMRLMPDDDYDARVNACNIIILAHWSRCTWSTRKPPRDNRHGKRVSLSVFLYPSRIAPQFTKALPLARAVATNSPFFFFCAQTHLCTFICHC